MWTSVSYSNNCTVQTINHFNPLDGMRLVVFYKQNCQSALDNKTIIEADIDQAVERTFNILVRLAYFDPPEPQPYRQLSAKDVDTNQ